MPSPSALVSASLQFLVHPRDGEKALGIGIIIWRLHLLLVDLHLFRIDVYFFSAFVPVGCHVTSREPSEVLRIFGHVYHSSSLVGTSVNFLLLQFN
jgi:hypothetical protein